MNDEDYLKALQNLKSEENYLEGLDAFKDDNVWLDSYFSKDVDVSLLFGDDSLDEIEGFDAIQIYKPAILLRKNGDSKCIGVNTRKFYSIKEINEYFNKKLVYVYSTYKEKDYYVVRYLTNENF